ncbi:spore germination protein [Geobacillus sp. FSL K6-0789]|uniref:Protein GerPA required for proper assembly of spore coat mutations lead to super-dormant spore n=1 Tax=Geobacillus stearothermophilus TaxID=1422 RepID=A0A0K9I197_GEOSE|nr:spore germination protein [Geobacillus stearothermophilus]KAF6511053.1 Protein GerPA required for proper assembly of spore coat mutations lead to super-dormant spore [Geobacillus stearothermophilus]KMY61224.1 spore gernimation protein GerPA [Geobacillus stearothermophilus]KMY62421.1 spore gernimation protein GerPA [Geobacillus stearothermophilus]KMY64082.1 spore gernimation protein GerPA [Geobacillus stearothermophilus]KOR94469.1 spore gernimation protein GerPA [Geobacillus stearothermophil
MPAFVGIVKLNSIGSSSVFHIGDVFAISPQSVTKTFAGAGSFNTGDGLHIYNYYSNTNTNDADVADENVIGNV